MAVHFVSVCICICFWFSCAPDFIAHFFTFTLSHFHFSFYFVTSHFVFWPCSLRISISFYFISWIFLKVQTQRSRKKSLDVFRSFCCVWKTSADISIFYCSVISIFFVVFVITAALLYLFLFYLLQCSVSYIHCAFSVWHHFYLP